MIRIAIVEDDQSADDQLTACLEKLSLQNALPHPSLLHSQALRYLVVDVQSEWWELVFLFCFYPEETREFLYNLKNTPRMH